MEYIAITDRSTAMQGVRFLTDPCRLQRASNHLSPLINKHYSSDMKHLVSDCELYDLGKSIRDCISLLELIVQFDVILVDKFTYKSIDNMLTDGWPDCKLEYLDFINKPDKDENIKSRNSKLLRSLLIDNKVLRPYDINDSDSIKAQIKNNPYFDRLDRAVANSYQAVDAHIFFDAYIGHLATNNSHLRLSCASAPYYDLASGFSEVKPTLTLIDNVVRKVTSNYSAIVREITEYSKAFPIYNEVKLPFFFHLALSRARCIERIVDAVLEIREDFRRLRLLLIENEQLLADSTLSLKKRLEAKQAIDCILEEAAKPFDIADAVSSTCWRDFMRDLWTVPKNMFDGITADDIQAKDLTKFILTYPVDLILKIIKNRRLCNLPRLKSKLLSTRTFTTDFQKVFGCSISSVIIQSIHKYETNNSINRQVLSYFEHPRDI